MQRGGELRAQARPDAPPPPYPATTNPYGPGYDYGYDNGTAAPYLDYSYQVPAYNYWGYYGYPWPIYSTFYVNWFRNHGHVGRFPSWTGHSGFVRPFAGARPAFVSSHAFRSVAAPRAASMARAGFSGHASGGGRR
jgi:hypothetical protein